MPIFNKYIFFLILLILSTRSFSQLNVNVGTTPAQMVQNTLIGNGIITSNVTYIGGGNSRGIFTNGNTTNLGLNSGILLTSGVAAQVANPASYLMSTNLNLNGDPDLDAINSGTPTYDACVLEFDFIPLSDTVKFRYVFGSEEYPNFVCSQYQDVFAFFISGPNPAGGNYVNYNIARIPGSTLPVSVNSVNNGSPGNNYNASGCVSLSYNNYYVDNAALNGTTIAFGGFTVPLTAWCHVIPCESYHIKIAVADGGGKLLDSGVFLEANSFSANTFQVATSYTDTITNMAVEGCSQGMFTFTLSAPATSPYTINYTIGGTAINGTDYTSIPSSITIPTGQSSASIIIDPIADGITEGIETVTITYLSNCTTQTSTIQIADYELMTIALTNDTSICLGNSLNIMASVQGGSPPYTYAWNNGAGTNNISVSPLITTVYGVSITDECAQMITASTTVFVDSLSLTLTSQEALCNQNNGSAHAVVYGGCTPINYNWSNTATSSSITNVSGGSYTLTVSCGACTVVESIIIENIPGPLIVTDIINNSNCGMDDGNASINISGGTPPYSFLWNTQPPQNTQNIQNVASGNYIVSVTDDLGCVSIHTLFVDEYAKPIAAFSAMPTITVLGSGITFENFSQGGTQYYWNFGDGTHSTVFNPFHTYHFAGTYTVWLFVQNNHNCIDSVSHDVIINESVTFYVPNAFTPDGDGINDNFGPKGIGINNEHYTFYIFNRWGEMVFKTNDPHHLWDGTELNSGKICKQDIYTWLILLKVHDGREHLIKHTGVVTLM